MSVKGACVGWGVSSVMLSLYLLACGSTGDSPVALQVRFATSQQAVSSSGGLTAEVLAVKINFSRGDQTLVDSGCIPVSANSPKRTSISFDITPGDNTVVTVDGHGTADCSDSPAWRGKSAGVTVQKGREIQVPIYVIRRGQRLNPVRAGLSAPRAFSSASLLSNGLVLVAGGFSSAEKKDNVIRLQAACDAVLYDPGTATFSDPIPLEGGCRGLHRALNMSDGRILLVGGSSSATFDASGISRPLLSADANTLLSSAEVFDPTNKSFESIGVSSALQRADAAAVLTGTQTVLLGGRTNLIRSNDIVSSSDNINWVVAPPPIPPIPPRIPRSGAQAVSLSQGILVAGGNADNTATLELLNSDTFAQLSPPAITISAVSGHTLTPIGSTEAFLAGGVYDGAGLGLSDKGFGITWTEPITLNHPRAYHAAETLPDGLVLLAGGITTAFASTSDLEIIDTVNLNNPHVTPTDVLTIGPVGMASARLPDDSVLLVGGFNIGTDGTVILSSDAQLFSP